MTEKDIINLVHECFEKNISIMTVGRGNYISGEEEFYDELLVELKKLFNDNDLSKF